METCSLCQGFIPGTTAQCPHCDAPLVQPKKGFAQKLLGVVTGGALSVTLMACYGLPPAVCGDGVAESWRSEEECDDANTLSGDGCSSTCQVEEGCGDGNIDPEESCDDDNVLDGDGCSSQCAKEPGFVCTGESPSVCTYICGDGILVEYVTVDFSFTEPAEQCDDGNTESGDGCSSDCQLELCGDGVINSGVEECDNGANNGLADPTLNPGDCRTDCTLVVCGDGLIESQEQCDDGNQDDTDACRNDCTAN